MSTPVENNSAASPSVAGDDAKRARILQGAMKVVLAYGYSRTTMDDIARAADMSRPALYVSFRNKADIYRAIAASMMDQSIDLAHAALAEPGSLGDRLVAAIDRCVISFFSEIVSSPHGAELLDMKSSLAGDLTGKWQAALTQAFKTAVEAEAARSGVDLAARGLTSDTLAYLLLDGLEGMKTRLSDPSEQRKAARAMVTVVERALQP